MRHFQKLGKQFTFRKRIDGQIQTDTCRLPQRFGVNTKKVRWCFDRRTPHGGSWTSRKLYREWHRALLMGYGKNGLHSRMGILLRNLKRDAKRHGYKPPAISAAGMVAAWRKQDNFCAACQSPILLFEASADHNHQTGEFRGFIHRSCNQAEGHLTRMSDVELDRFLAWYLKTRGK